MHLPALLRQGRRPVDGGRAVIDEKGIAHGMPGHSKCVVVDPAAWAPGNPLCNPQHLRPLPPRREETPRSEMRSVAAPNS